MTNYREAELYVPAMRLLYEAPQQKMTTSELIAGMEEELKPTGTDAELLDGRNDSHFSQKVRNIVSHKGSPNNPIQRGFVQYLSDEKSLALTDKGVAHVKSLKG